jgi:hypothetical protein
MVNPNVQSPAGVAADIAEVLGMPVSVDGDVVQGGGSSSASQRPKRTQRSKRMVRRR